MRDRITMLRLLLDIRSERAIKFVAIYASCLSVYFYYQRTIQTPLGITETVDSKDYFAILLILASVAVSWHHHACRAGLTP